VDYSKPHAIRIGLAHLEGLWRLGVKGDTVALSIYFDLTQAVYADGIITDRQRDILTMWLDGFSQIDIATKYRISQQQVSVRINRAICNISKKIRGRELYMGSVYIASDKPRGESITDIEISRTLRCAGCHKEHPIKDLRLTGGSVYRCANCYQKYLDRYANKKPVTYNPSTHPSWVFYGGHRFSNINSTGEVYENGYCPVCFLILTTEKKCPSVGH